MFRAEHIAAHDVQQNQQSQQRHIGNEDSGRQVCRVGAAEQSTQKAHEQGVQGWEDGIFRVGVACGGDAGVVQGIEALPGTEQ